MSLVGMKVFTKVQVLGNPVGTIGYVYQEYTDFDDPEKLGVSVIFKNGRYDGFSAMEREYFLDEKEIVPDFANYEFKNVITLVCDNFNNNYWRLRE